MLVKVVSGGQSGADQGGWLAAAEAGIPTGGWMPSGFETEYDPRPEFARLYDAAEHESANPAARTRANARDSDATLWFGDPATPGGRCTLAVCRAIGRPLLIVSEGRTRPSEVAAWLEEHRVGVLNVAGNRQSKSPGLDSRVEAFMLRVFAWLADGRP